MQNSSKFTKFRQSEYIFGILSLQASSCNLFYHKMSIFRRKVQLFVGGQSELSLVTLMQNGAKVDKVCQREHIFGNFSLQASSCIHSHPKLLNFLWKVQFLLGGQSELTLVTLMQNGAKVDKFCQREHIFGNFSLQASSCIHSHPKVLNFLRKVQFLVGGQSELTLVTLMQNSAKINKFCQSEYIVGILSLQASRCIHFYRKKSIFCRKMQIFVGGQNELTLVTLMQNSEKSTNFVKENTFLAILAFKHLVASFRTQNYSIFAEECKFW